MNNEMITRIKWLIRLLYLVLVILYVITLRNEFSYMPIPFSTFVKWTIMSALFNSGVWIITTKWGKRWKFLSLFLCLPTLIISPTLLLLGDWFVISAYCLLLPGMTWGYFYWRNYESRSFPT